MVDKRFSVYVTFDFGESSQKKGTVFLCPFNFYEHLTDCLTMVPGDRWQNKKVPSFKWEYNDNI